MPAFYIAPEASIKYTFVGPTGARAVLNDPTDPDFVGYLDGEEAISGIESPEIRDSYTDLADADGGMAGSNFYSRRPIVMNGKVFPTSASDRNTKLGKLMAATDARFADGTLTWTPTGGEPVFVKFRRQLPFRAKGGFNKEFQLGLVCPDPRIYTQRAMTIYTETNGNSANQDFRRFTWASGSNALFASRPLYLPPGVWKVSVPVKSSVNSRTVTAGLSSSSGTNTPLALSTAWQMVTQTLTTTNPAGTATDLSLVLSSALTAGQYIEVGDPVLESAAGLYPAANATFAGNWVTNSNYTMTFVTSSPPNNYGVMNPGNALSAPRQRTIGPFSQIAPAANGLNYMRIYPSVAYISSDYAVVDYLYRTVTKNNSTSDYASVPSSPTSLWGGYGDNVQGAPIIYGIAGCSTATRMETTWRGVWL